MVDIKEYCYKNFPQITSENEELQEILTLLNEHKDTINLKKILKIIKKEI